MGPIVNLLKIAIAHLSRVSCIQLCRLLQNRSGKTRKTYKHFNKNTLLDYFPFNTWEVRLSLSHRWRRYRINPLQVSLWMQTKPPTKCQKRRHIFVSSSFPFLDLYLLRVPSPRNQISQRHISRVPVWVGLKGRNKPRCSTIGMAGRPIIERLLRALWTADIFLIIILSHLNGKRYAAKITSSTICKWINICSVEKDWHFEPRVQQLFSLK